MKQVYLSKKNFLALAEKMSNEALRKGEILFVSAMRYGLHIVDYEIDIEYIYDVSKEELYEMILDLTGLSDNIHII